MDKKKYYPICVLALVLLVLYFSIPSATAVSASINPKSGPAGSAITVTGGGFTPNARATIGVQGETYFDILYPGSGGTITSNTVIPRTLTPGTYTLSIVDTTTGASALVQFTVTSSAASSPTPAATPTPTPGPTSTVPEFTTLALLPLLALPFIVVLFLKKRDFKLPR